MTSPRTYATAVRISLLSLRHGHTSCHDHKTVRNWDDRLTIFRSTLSLADDFRGATLLTAFDSAIHEGRLFERLMNRINSCAAAHNDHAIVISDEGKNARYRALARRLGRHNPIPDSALGVEGLSPKTFPMRQSWRKSFFALPRTADSFNWLISAHMLCFVPRYRIPRDPELTILSTCWERFSTQKLSPRIRAGKVSFVAPETQEHRFRWDETAGSP
jgi:hypothetical protein